MPNSKGAGGTEKPPVDPSAILGRIEGIIKSNRKSGSSWVSTLIIGAIVLMGAAIFAWVSHYRGRELAKLRHEKETARILAAKSVIAAKVASNDAERAEAERKRLELSESIRRLEADIRMETARREADLRAIDRIRSWRDVDPSAGG